MKYFIICLFLNQFVFSQKNSDKKRYDSNVTNYSTIVKKNEVWDREPDIIKPVIKGSPPSDAIVLFDGNDFSKWHHSKTKKPVKWLLNGDKSLTIKPGTGSIETKEEHESVQLHIEWKSPIENNGQGQLRGNSGIFFQRRYEVQVLNSYENKTYPDGQAGSIYKQHIPLVNAMLPTGEWQVYDIIFNAPKYNDTGDIVKPGSFIVFHNGVLIQNVVEIKEPTMSIEKDTRKTLMLQDHDKNGSVSYKNIWMRKI